MIILIEFHINAYIYAYNIRDPRMYQALNGQYLFPFQQQL